MGSEAWRLSHKFGKRHKDVTKVGLEGVRGSPAKDHPPALDKIPLMPSHSLLVDMEPQGGFILN